jgi:hypothetical protein
VRRLISKSTCRGRASAQCRSERPRTWTHRARAGKKRSASLAGSPDCVQYKTGFIPLHERHDLCCNDMNRILYGTATDRCDCRHQGNEPKRAHVLLDSVKSNASLVSACLFTPRTGQRTGPRARQLHTQRVIGDSCIQCGSFASGLGSSDRAETGATGIATGQKGRRSLCNADHRGSLWLVDNPSRRQKRMQAPPSRPPSRPSSASVASSSRSTLARAGTQGRQSHASPALASHTLRPSMPTPAGHPTAPEPTPMHGSYRYPSQQHQQRPNTYHHSYTSAGPGVRVKVEDGPAPAAPHRFPSYTPGQPSRAMDPASQQQQWAYDDDALVPLSPRSRPSGLLPLQQIYPQQNQMSMQVAMHGAVQMQMTQMSFFQVPPGYYPGPLNAQQFGPGTTYGQYPPDGRFYNPSPQPAYPMYSAPNMRSAPPLATSKNSNKENDDDGYPVHQCPKCEKQYRGKHARSIWRRHLQDKHGIPLSMQVRRSRWDAGQLIASGTATWC